jgi:O-antigen biosynthesis protein
MSYIRKVQTFLIVPLRGLLWLFFGHNVRKFSKIWATYKYGGLKLCWHRAVEKFNINSHSYEYTQNQLSLSQSEYLFSLCTYKPLISIITPVYKIDCNWLEKCISSVVNQHYQNWELILIDDASDNAQIKKLMDSWTSRDKRIFTYYIKENSGIACSTNFGIRHANGTFIGFLDHDDELTPDALTWIVWALKKSPDAQWIYSDEDKISSTDKCYDPRFKPNFSPELLLSNMFTCHFSVYSSRIIAEVGGLRLGFEGAQDHDLALRISEVVPKDKVIHIPRILYHWRSIPGSAAMSTEEKPLASESGRRAVKEALERRKIKAQVKSHRLKPTLYQIMLEPTSFPEVSIIIPTKNSLALLKQCLGSIISHTKYPNYNIVVIDNQSNDTAFLKYIIEKQSENLIKIIKYDKPFNHSDMNNVAVQSVSSDLIVLMNNDIKMLSDNWLEQLVATVNIDESVACAGCLLLYKNMTVQQAGIILGIHSLTGHSHQYMYGELPGYYCSMQSLQEVSAVTGALLIVKRSAFVGVGGFRSEIYPNILNDVDLCLRLKKKGYRCLYNPMIRAIHYESKTRKIGPEEFTYTENFRKEYSEILLNDPFYNPNLTLDNQVFQGFRSFSLEKQIPELAEFRKKR